MRQTHNPVAFGIGLKKAIAKKKNDGETKTNTIKNMQPQIFETDLDILAGTHEWVTENIETGAGKGARQTIVVKRRVNCDP